MSFVHHDCNLITAADVATLRNSTEARGNTGSLSPKCDYSNRSSQKLYQLLTTLHAKGGYSHTFGALDPVQVIQMAPHLSSIYISGWQCSSTASTTNEPGPDFADYPMNTVPNKCEVLFSSCLIIVSHLCVISETILPIDSYRISLGYLSMI